MARLIDRKDKEQAQVVQEADTTRQVISTRKNKKKFLLRTERILRLIQTICSYLIPLPIISLKRS